MAQRITIKAAKTLLDRFFREAEGRTNHKLDVGFLLDDAGLSREKAEPALEFLSSRGLLNAFGPEVAFLTDRGVQAAAEDWDLGELDVARNFGAGESQPPRSAGPRLTLVTTDGTSRSVDLQGSCTIGRAPENDIEIEDKRASKRHARVRFDGSAYVLEDLDSANGTLLNGSYCVQPTRLTNDDEIVIGRTMIVYAGPSRVEAPSGYVPSASELPEASGEGVTERPRSSPQGDGSGIRVVRGRPDAPSDLFQPVGSSPDALDATVDAELRHPSTDEDFIESEDPTPAPPISESSGGGRAPEEHLPPFPRSPNEVEDPPTLFEPDGPLIEHAEHEPIELSDIVSEGPTPISQRDNEPVTAEGPSPTSETEETVSIALLADASDPPTVDAQPAPRGFSAVARGAEDLPEASQSLADFELPAEVLRSLPLLMALERLESRVRDVVGQGQHPLVDAIALVREHPLVRALAEEDGSGLS